MYSWLMTIPRSAPLSILKEMCDQSEAMHRQKTLAFLFIYYYFFIFWKASTVSAEVSFFGGADRMASHL